MYSKELIKNEDNEIREAMNLLYKRRGNKNVVNLVELKEIGFISRRYL